MMGSRAAHGFVPNLPPTQPHERRPNSIAQVSLHVSTPALATSLPLLRTTFEQAVAHTVGPKRTLVTTSSGDEPPAATQTVAVAAASAALQPGLKNSQPDDLQGAPRHKKARHFPLYSPCLSFRLDPSSESEWDDTDVAPNRFRDLGKGVWSWFCQEDSLPEAWLQEPPPDCTPPPLRYSTFKSFRLHNQIQRVCFPETALPLRAVAKPSFDNRPLDALLLAAFVFLPRVGTQPLREIVLARLAEPEVYSDSEALRWPTTPRMVALPPPADEKNVASSCTVHTVRSLAQVVEDVSVVQASALTSPVSQEIAIKIETAQPDSDFDLESYIRELPGAPQFDGDASLFGALPPCLMNAARPTPTCPRPAVVNPTPVTARPSCASSPPVAVQIPRPATPTNYGSQPACALAAHKCSTRGSRQQC